MKEFRDRKNTLIGHRLASLRKEKGLTQSKFGEQFSAFCNKKNTYLVPTISSWEQNHRLPPIEVLILLAQYYNVSLDYLAGLTNEKNESKKEVLANTKTRALVNHLGSPINESEMIKYNGMPVYVVFSDNEHLSQWGILNSQTDEVVCRDYIVSISDNVVCYPYAPINPVNTRISSYQQLLHTPYVWIEMKSTDPWVSAQYNGRYHHNENHSCLINMHNNLTLNYEGLDIGYWAFRG